MTQHSDEVLETANKLLEKHDNARDAILEVLDQVEFLEENIRRYCLDKSPDRRISILRQFRERLGMDTWQVREEKRTEAMLAKYGKTLDDL